MLDYIFFKLYTFGMEEIEELGNYIVVDEEPEFVAEAEEDISATFFILCENSSQENLVKNIYEYEICGLTASVTLGESLIITGFLVTALTARVTAAAASGWVPKLMPPPWTLGQETLTSSQPTCSSLSSFSQV